MRYNPNMPIKESSLSGLAFTVLDNESQKTEGKGFTELNSSNSAPSVTKPAKKSKTPKPTLTAVDLPKIETAAAPTDALPVLKTSGLTIEDASLEGMNKTEAGYYRYLLSLKNEGKILAVAYECEKLKLARSTYYTPDFRVIKPDGTVEFHETKGFWRDDARVKIKVAATLHPYKFYIIQKLKGRWEKTLVEV